MIKLIRNSAQCNRCKEILVSRHVHDFVACQCFNSSGGRRGITIDGGTDYLKRSGDKEDINELSIFEEVKDE